MKTDKSTKVGRHGHSGAGKHGPAATKKSMATKPKGKPVVMKGGAQAYHGPNW